MTANFNSDQGKRTTEWTLYGVCKGCGVAGSSMDHQPLSLHHIGCPRPGREDIRVVRAASDEEEWAFTEEPVNGYLFVGKITDEMIERGARALWESRRSDDDLQAEAYEQWAHALPVFAERGRQTVEAVLGAALASPGRAGSRRGRMTHYSRTWNCWVCLEHQESVDLPKLQVCDVCLTPVARVLCKRELGVDLEAEGVDRHHWMRRADAVIHPMMRRRREPANV